MPRNKKKLKCSQEVIGRFFRWRLSRRASGVYYADGRGNAIKLGRHSLGTKNKEEALNNIRLLDLKLAVQFGLTDDAIMDLPADQRLSIEQGAQRYLQHVGRPDVTGGSTSAQKRYKPVLDKFMDFTKSKGITSWQEVGEPVLQAYAQWLDDREYEYTTQYLELTTLKQALKYLANSLHVPGIRAVTLRMPKSEETSTYCYTRDQVAAMIEHCGQEPQLRWLSHVLVALATTGLRISELAELRWTDVDMDEQLLKLTDESRRGTFEQRQRARKLKGRRGRELPIHDALQKVLQQLPRHRDGRVFHGPNGGKLKPDTVLLTLKRDVIKPLARRFPSIPGQPGFKDGKVHSFRHYFCSICADSGVPEPMLKNWLGHRDSKMVRRYYHSDREAARSRLNQVDFLGGPAMSRGPIVFNPEVPESASKLKG